MEEVSLLSQLASQPTAGSRRTIAIVVSAATEPPGARDPYPVGEISSWRDRSVENAQFLIRSLLCDGYAFDDDLARLEAGTDEHIDVRTPALHTSSRHELLSALVNVDDAITDVQMTFTESAGRGSVVMLEWMATGRFSHAAFLNDDQLLEPTGAVVHIAGAATVAFSTGWRAERIRCSYDRLALIEQMLAPPPFRSCG